MNKWQADGVTDARWLACMLATALLETSERRQSPRTCTIRVQSTQGVPEIPPPWHRPMREHANQSGSQTAPKPTATATGR